MKKEIFHITDAEMELMKILWQANRPVSGSELNHSLTHTGWCLSTIHSLALRLANKGAIKHLKVNGSNYYFPAITEFDYRFMMSKTLVNRLYRGSLTELVKTLLCDWDLSADELGELKSLVDKAILPREATSLPDADSAAAQPTGEATEDEPVKESIAWKTSNPVWFIQRIQSPYPMAGSMDYRLALSLGSHSP